MAVEFTLYGFFYALTVPLCMLRIPSSQRMPVIIGIACVVYLLFVGGLASWLWSREHYQYFPVVIIGALLLAWTRFEQIDGKHSPRVTWRVILLGLMALLLLVVACFLQSNLAGTLSAICTLWTLTWYFGGRSAANALAGPIFLLLLIIPLPLNLDLKLVIGLQKIASTAASHMLDLVDIRHNISGVAIATVERSFMVEEACSGIHSLFSCVCVVAFISVLQRSGFVRVVGNVAQTVCWVIAANAMRVFVVVYAFSTWGMALDSGWKHDALGIFTYAAALLMALSTERLILFLVPMQRRGQGKTDAVYGESDNPAAQLMTSLESSGKRMNSILNRGLLSEQKSFVCVLSVLLVLFFPLSAVSYGRMFASLVASAPDQQAADDPDFVASLSNRFSAPSVMPEEVGHWKLTGVEQVSRSADDPLGTNSAVFTYNGGGLTAQFSIDGFYPNWHDLAYCYTALDWKVRSQTNFRTAEADNHATELAIYTEGGRHGLIYFSCFDSRTQSVVPDEPTIGKISTFSNLLERLGVRESRQPQIDIHPPVFQLQLMCATRHDLMEHEQEHLQQLFRQLSRHALTTLQGAGQ